MPGLAVVDEAAEGDVPGTPRTTPGAPPIGPAPRGPRARRGLRGPPVRPVRGATVFRPRPADPPWARPPSSAGAHPTADTKRPPGAASLPRSKAVPVLLIYILIYHNKRSLFQIK